MSGRGLLPEGEGKRYSQIMVHQVMVGHGWL